jgi:hypothetical protein
VRRPPHRLGLGLALLALVVAIGCTDVPEPPKKIGKSVAQPAPTTKPKPKPEPVAKLVNGVRVEVGKLSPGQCRRTLCISGPGELDSEPNADLAELCRRSPGIVMSCEGQRCASVWAVDRWQQGLDALVGTLDRNADGRVDEKDGECPVNLAGWSTGAAVIASELPKALAERVDAKHARIHNLVAITPFAAGRESQQLDIAANVDKAFIYRHSVAPDNDCSRTFEGGPWLSAAPVCAEGTTCYDYDYTKDVGDLAYLSRRGSRSGAEIHHCNIVSVVAKLGLDNLARGQEAYTELLPPYADGTHGGRPRIPVYQPTPP